MAEKFNQEKEKNEKLKELKARLNFEGCFGTSRYSESKTMSTKEHGKRHRSRRSRSPRTSVFSRIRRERSRSPIRRERLRSPRQRAKEGGVFKSLGSRGKSVSARSDSYDQHSHSRYTKALSKNGDSGGGHSKSRSKKKKSSGEDDDLSQPYCDSFPALSISSICFLRPRVSVKGQILADFIVERPEEDPSDTPMEEEDELPEPWILFMDGSSCTDGSVAGLILTNPEGMKFAYALRFRFDATNNEAEYESLIAELRIAE
nr:reverse transcriptase domain-containing protein [Tanacetum cinerariifolium]